MTRLMIGVGNEYRSDDRAGLEVARRVASMPTKESSLGGFELMDMWAHGDDVLVVDAMRSDADPGTVFRFDAIAAPLPRAQFASTHAIGIAETVEMARRLGRLPRSLFVYGIEAACVANGTGVSPEVQSAIHSLVLELDGAPADA